MQLDDRATVDFAKLQTSFEPRHSEDVAFAMQADAALAIRRVLGLEIKVKLVRAPRRQDAREPRFAKNAGG